MTISFARITEMRRRTRYGVFVRKVIVFMMTTLDGFFAGPKGEIDWHVVDDRINLKLLKTKTFSKGVVLLCYQKA